MHCVFMDVKSFIHIIIVCVLFHDMPGFPSHIDIGIFCCFVSVLLSQKQSLTMQDIGPLLLLRFLIGISHNYLTNSFLIMIVNYIIV